MKRSAVISTLPMLLLLAACPKDKPKADTIAVVPPPAAVDTPVDLSSVQSNLPPAEPDTFKVRTPKPVRETSQPAQPSYPEAPAALMETVNREKSFSRFCYTEFGQKSDPTLRGGVAMIVSVSSSGIDDARVGNDSWSSSAGKNVNKCLNEKAHLAWKLEAGAVKPGKYRVPLTFSGG
jgi:hypothetical protein